jgi:hypothetical protein
MAVITPLTAFIQFNLMAIKKKTRLKINETERSAEWVLEVFMIICANSTMVLCPKKIA